MKVTKMKLMVKSMTMKTMMFGMVMMSYLKTIVKHYLKTVNITNNHILSIQVCNNSQPEHIFDPLQKFMEKKTPAAYLVSCATCSAAAAPIFNPSAH